MNSQQEHIFASIKIGNVIINLSANDIIELKKKSEYFNVMAQEITEGCELNIISQLNNIGPYKIKYNSRPIVLALKCFPTFAHLDKNKYNVDINKCTISCLLSTLLIMDYLVIMDKDIETYCKTIQDVVIKKICADGQNWINVLNDLNNIQFFEYLTNTLLNMYLMGNLHIMPQDYNNLTDTMKQKMFFMQQYVLHRTQFDIKKNNNAMQKLQSTITKNNVVINTLKLEVKKYEVNKPTKVGVRHGNRTIHFENPKKIVELVCKLK